MSQDKTVSQEAIQAFKEAVSFFDYSDFVEGTEPYDLLDDSAVTPEARLRFSQILEKRAQQCGVPIRMIRAIMKERNSAQHKPQQVAETIGGVFDFEGQPIQLQSGKYTQQKDMICIEDKFGLEIVCPHPIIPTKRFINIDTGTESLEISFKREYWKSIIVERGKLASASTIVQLADHGISVTSESSRQLVKYIAYIDDLNRDIIPIEQMSSHLGWINETDFVPYIDGVEYDGQGQFLQMFKTIHAKGKYQKWLDTVLQIRAAGCVQARLVMAASFASVLLAKFDALPFFVHLWSAQSGTGKTVTMELAASIWADPKVGAYCRPLKSTTVGLEQLAVFTCNLPLCLDELQTIQNRSGFDDIIYSLCEGSGKTRGARNGGLRSSPSWNNAIITTGEMPIIGSGSKAGAMNRVLEIECKGALLPNAKNVHRTIISNYGYAGKLFIDALADSETLEEIEQEQQKIFEMLVEKGTDKQALSASVLLAADHAAERIIFHDGVVLSESDIMPFVKSEDDVDSGRRAHEYLLEWIAENRSGFVVDDDLDGVRNRTIYGCVETDKETGHAKTVWIIGKSFNEALTDGGFSPDSYLSWAQGENLIQTAGNQKKIVKRIPGTGVTARCVCVVLDATKESQEKWGKIVQDVDLPW